MSSTLSAYGTGFNVEAFMQTSTLKAEIWHEGERRGLSDEVNKTSGLRIEILDDFDSLRAQIDAAVKVLSANRDELQRLGKAAAGFWFVLQFGIVVTDEIVVWVDAIPPELSRLAGEVGCLITISHYPSEERLERLEASRASRASTEQKESDTK